MNTATENLEKDHENILRLISVMEKMISSESRNTDHYEKVVQLIREFADGFHHAKEEKLLFPMMVKKGFSLEQGPVAVMLAEHEQGRAFVQGMAAGIQSVKEGNNDAFQDIHENMRGYSALLRGHIDKENNILFRMADNVLSEDEQQGLITRFLEVEEGKYCGGTTQDCISAIDDLENTYLK